MIKICDPDMCVKIIYDEGEIISFIRGHGGIRVYAEYEMPLGFRKIEGRELINKLYIGEDL